LKPFFVCGAELVGQNHRRMRGRHRDRNALPKS
jgi:hypothetical protein